MADILYTNGPFFGIRQNFLPDPPPETLAGDAYVGMAVNCEPIFEHTVYHRYDCVDGVWLYRVNLT